MKSADKKGFSARAAARQKKTVTISQEIDYLGVYNRHGGRPPRAPTPNSILIGSSPVTTKNHRSLKLVSVDCGVDNAALEENQNGIGMYGENYEEELREHESAEHDPMVPITEQIIEEEVLTTHNNYNNNYNNNSNNENQVVDLHMV